MSSSQSRTGGQYTNMFFQAKMLGLESQWSQIKKNYAEANLLLGDIIKVTPSSKVVGDFAQFMTSKNLTADEVVARAGELDMPSSVVEFLQGQLGIPVGGFPEPLRSRVLAKAGLKGIEGRPGAVLPPMDFKAIQQTLEKKHGPQFARNQDVNSYAMYPAVFEEYVAAIKKFGQVTHLPTPYFLEPLVVGSSNACTFQLPNDEPVNARLVGVNPVTGQDDVWAVTLEVNGLKELINVKTKKKGATPYVLKDARSAVADTGPAVVTAVAGNSKELGSPLPGKIARFLVEPGARVTKGQAVLVLNSMKMETSISAPSDGVVTFFVEKGQEVITNQLLVRFK